MKKRTTHLHASHRKLQKGMTLIEVLVVLTIIAIIATLAAIAVMPQIEASKQNAARIDISTIINALDLYYAQKGNYPDPSTGLQALVAARILDKIPEDPWNRAYAYVIEGGKAVVISYGKDGRPGGEGDDEDISSKNLKKKQEN